MLLWAIAAGAFFKFVLQEGIARWQLATGKTALEGWADHLPAWVKWYFGVYLVFWTVAVSASLTNATGLGMANLTGGAIPQSWGAVAHSLIGGLLIYFGGYNNFEKLMKLLVGVMGFSILICALFTLHQPLTALQGLLMPIIPAGSGTYVLSLIGGVGGSITMLSYNYWMREEGHARRRLPVVRPRRHRDRLHLHRDLRRLDHADRQRRVLHRRAWRCKDAEAVPKMAAALGTCWAPSAASPSRSASGPRCSRRCSASGRACRISMPTSTAS